MITMGALVPHPPIMVDGIGGHEDFQQIEKTRWAMQSIAKKIEESQPETVVIFTPHGTVYRDAVIVYGDRNFSGDLSRFGLTRTWHWENDLPLAEAIEELGRNVGLPVYMIPLTEASRGREKGLDHGVLAPLSFFRTDWFENVKLVVIPLSYLSLEELYQFGAVVAKAAEQLNRRVAVIASGDLSHCLKPGAPAGYRPEGAEFDRRLVELISANEVVPFFELNPHWLEKAAECGFRSVIMLLGTMDGLDFQGEVYSYEGPFGVGYAVASFTIRGKRESLQQTIFDARKARVAKRRSEESALVRYARKVVEAYVSGEKLPEPEGLEEFRGQKAGVFVSLKENGQLRGCIGTTEPTQDDIIEEVTHNAIAAATRDPRFDPVEEFELDNLVYSVDVLKPAEPVIDMRELDPKRYGVIVSRGSRKGLLLPDLEGVDTAEEQVAIARRKAGISPDEPVELQRFEVVRYF